MTTDADPAATPLPSATVVLVRDTDSGPEVLLVRRHARASYGKAYVFPGGLLEPGDRHVHDVCAGDRAGRATACLRIEAGALDYYSAAIRELFEETGVLLARTPAGNWPLPSTPDDTAAFDALRHELNCGALDWPTLLGRRQLSLDCDQLHYVAHWITPVRMPKRFTTRFFVAALPDGQAARHDGGELTDSCWMSAAAALAAGKAGDMTLPNPTRYTLRDLARLDSVSAILKWAADREAAGVDACLPVIVGAPGEERVLMPGDPQDPAQANAGNAA